MSGSVPHSANQPPKARPIGARSATVAALDIGTSKVACMIARLTPAHPGETLRGRSHAVELIGYAQLQSRGVKAGAVVDLLECEAVVRNAVSLAEKMAKVHVESVLLSVSAGRIQGQMIEAAADIKGGAVGEADIARATSAGLRHAAPPGRAALHALPLGFTLDGVKGVRDPRGMVAQQFAVDMSVVTADAAALRNLMLVVERCHLNVESVAASPYLAGLALLTQDETDQGVALVELGAGTTTVGVHADGRFVHATGFAVGGHHITMDLSRGLGTPVADAERIKTLHGSVLTGGSDAREMVDVPVAPAQDEPNASQMVSRADISAIIRPRAEEIFEMVRDRLAASPFAAETHGRVVLSGGGAQLTGIAELATRILGREVRIGRPLGFTRLPAEARGAAFAVPAGLLLYPQFVHLEHVERNAALHSGAASGYLGKVSRWLRDGF